MTNEAWIAVGVLVLGVVGFFVKRVLASNDRAHNHLEDKVDKVTTHLSAQDALLTGLQVTVSDKVGESTRRFEDGTRRMDRLGSQIDTMQASQVSTREDLAEIKGLLKGRKEP